MKRQLLTALLIAVSAPLAQAADEPPLIAEAQSLIKTFFGTLKGELQAAMKEGGPVNAIGVCNSRAPEIAHDISTGSGWSVARTSLKVRNPGNSPDPWETVVLQRFEERKASGEALDTMDHAEIVELNGKRTFRYMKPIPTAELCLNCHGSALQPEVAEKLDALYPQDRARGYAAGDIRGAFTLSKEL